jgi:hypothetical protein
VAGKSETWSTCAPKEGVQESERAASWQGPASVMLARILLSSTPKSQFGAAWRPADACECRFKRARTFSPESILPLRESCNLATPSLPG